MPDSTLHAALAQVHGCALAAHCVNEECEGLRLALAKQQAAAHQATLITATMHAELADQAGKLEQRVAALRPFVDEMVGRQLAGAEGASSI